MENQQQEALDVAVQLEKGFITLGKTARALRYEAAETIRRLHARVEELEKDRENAKRLVSKIWNQHPEARDTIEKATGAWLVFGQDVETSGVSAQRVTQGKDHIAQDRKMVSAPVVLPDGWTIVPVEPTPPMVEAGATERITPHITAGHGAIAAFKAMLEHAPEYPALASTTAAAPGVPNLDDYYCKGCGRIGEIEELSAQDKAKLRKLDGKPKTAAAPVVLPEPDEYQYRMKGNWDDKLPWTPWEACTKESAAIFRKLKEVHNWIYEVRERYTEQQVRELLAKDIDPVNLDRLGKALTKLGHAKWVSQAEAAAEIPRWVNALTSCVLEMPEAAPQPQADARDAERYLDYLIHNQARVCNNLDEYEGDEDCADCGYWLEFTDSNSQRWVQIGVFKNPRDAIDAAIAAAKET